ncbi:D-2-hydroxyglutarate dehydrogenase mitochondrial, partial [Bienertia sinuspersici]
MEKRRAYVLLWRWAVSSKSLVNHRPSLLTSFLTSHSCNSGYIFSEKLSLQVRFYGSAPVERSPVFSEINSKDISYFKSFLGENNVIQDLDRLQPANTDWMHKYKGSSKLMLLPRSTEERSGCSSSRGNTGLVGGSVPVFDE